MRTFLSSIAWLSIALLLGGVPPALAEFYTQHNLVSDLPGVADIQDPSLVNSWGLVATATSPWWVSNNGTNTSTLYTGDGTAQALVVGDRRPYVAALITLVEDVSHDDAEEEVQRAIDEVNHDLSRFEQIKRFTILPRDFTAEDGEVTPTLKLKRRVCQEHFAAEIEALYS
jgi:hypothetical protein